MMTPAEKKALSERDICTKFITPALRSAGWDEMTQLREEVSFTKGRVLVRGRITRRGESKRADYLLSYKPGVRLLVIEAKDNKHSVGSGMQQALDYADPLDVPFAVSSNGDAFLLHDLTGQSAMVETEIPLDHFPSPDDLWQRYCLWKGLSPAQSEVVAQDYHADAPDKEPRYYQENAINRTIEAIAKGQDRILLVMATGTGKTFVAFQTIWRLWKAGRKKRILFLADRNILVDQARVNDFKPFGGKMTKISGRKVDKSYEIYLSLYQAVSGTEEIRNTYKQFSADFFDLIVVDECHRGSAKEDSAWRDILTYFSSATQIGLTATPKETADLFLTLIIHLLRDGGRGAIVLPDGTLFGEGVKTRIKQELLEKCNLHTIVRLPNGVFAPYTGIKTNLLFFTKGEPTKAIWYYEHPYPPGVKSYNKTKPIHIQEFEAECKWWGKPGQEHKRKETEHAWLVSIDEIKAGNYNLDLKNPHNADTGPGNVDELLPEYEKLLKAIAETSGKLKLELENAIEQQTKR